MMKRKIANTVRVCVAAALFASGLAAAASQTALDRYVAQRDSVYGWKLLSTIPGEGYRTFVLELTSQRWRTEKDVDHPVWKHWLTVTVPNQVKSAKALLYIGEGDNTDPAPSKPSTLQTLITVETGSVSAEVFMVPNQPLRFTDSSDHPREEDDIIAYTRVKWALHGAGPR
jgi:PhoPQ-activated pathogenicity-related protein